MRRFLALLLALCFVLCFAACGNDDANSDTSSDLSQTQSATSTTETPSTGTSSSAVKPPHEHSYTSDITQNATCTDDGINTFSCSCGSSYTESIAATGHSWGGWTVTQEPTTAAEGNSQRKCGNCSSAENKSVPKLSVSGSGNGSVSQSQLQQIQSIFLALVNEERVSVGVSPLSSNTYLAGRAQIRSSEIMKNFSHTRPNGQKWSTVVDTSLYPYRSLGENICMTSCPATEEWVGSQAQIEATAGRIFTLFKNSPGHYANMIKEKFMECGIGISYEMRDGIPTFYLAHLFGKR